MKKLLQLMAISLITMMSYNIYCPHYEEKPQPHTEKFDPQKTAMPESSAKQTAMLESSMKEPQLQIVMPTTGGPYQIYQQDVNSGFALEGRSASYSYGKISPVKGNAISKSSLKQIEPNSYMRYFLALPSDKKEIPGTARTSNELINATKWVFSPNGTSNTIRSTNVIMPTTGGPYGIYMQQCAVNTKATCDSWQGQPVSAVTHDDNNYYFAGTTIYDRYFLALTSDQKEIPGTSRTGNELAYATKWEFSPDGKSNIATPSVMNIILPTTGGPYSIYTQKCAQDDGKTCSSWAGNPISLVTTIGNNDYIVNKTMSDRYFLALTSDQKEIPGTSRTGNELANAKIWVFSPDGKPWSLSPAGKSNIIVIQMM